MGTCFFKYIHDLNNNIKSSPNCVIDAVFYKKEDASLSKAPPQYF